MLAAAFTANFLKNESDIETNESDIETVLSKLPRLMYPRNKNGALNGQNLRVKGIKKRRTLDSFAVIVV